MFHAGVKPAMPRGAYSDFQQVEVLLQETNVLRGLMQVETADGVTEPAAAQGRMCRRTMATPNGGQYMYFRIDDSFKWADLMRVDLEVEYCDIGTGAFAVEFDGSDSNAPFAGAYTRAARTVILTGSGNWRTAVFALSGARFLNEQNAGSDFRIVVEAETVHVQRVRVRRFGVPQEAGQVMGAMIEDFASPTGSNWVLCGESGVTLHPSDGLIRLRGGETEWTRLAWQIPETSGLTREILARIRVVQPAVPGSWAGGAFLGNCGAVSEAVECQLRITQTGEKELALRNSSDATERAAKLGWTANRWYWLRLRHEMDGGDGSWEVKARLWQADGETREPPVWLVSWDRDPAQSAQTGGVGLVAPSAAARTDLECDFFMVRNEGLPEVLVRLPALKPERARLTWAPRPVGVGHALNLMGAPYQGYTVETTSDWREWTSRSIYTDALGFAPAGAILEESPGAEFYRAKVSE
jgi:hypothetical protein